MRDTAYITEVNDRIIVRYADQVTDIAQVLCSSASKADDAGFANSVNQLIRSSDHDLRRILGSGLVQRFIDRTSRALKQSIEGSDAEHVSMLVSELASFFDTELQQPHNTPGTDKLWPVAYDTTKKLAPHTKGRVFIGSGSDVLDELSTSAQSNISLVDCHPSEWLSVVEITLKQIDLCPSSAALVEHFCQHLIAIPSEDEKTHRSLSVNALPGHIFLSLSHRPFVMAEAIVHEADHQMLYRMKELDESVLPKPENEKSFFRSAWRPDPRPLSGLVFGLSAFSRVAAFFANVIEKMDDDGIDRKLAVRTCIALEQCRDAFAIIEGAMQPAPSAVAFMVSVSEELAETRAKLAACHGFDAWYEEAIEQTSKRRAAWNEEHGSLDELVLD